MERFTSRQIWDALAYADVGGQALHVWNSQEWPDEVAPVPICFRRSKLWGHLIDYDTARLKRTAKKLGVRVIKVRRLGTRGQHIDLCGRPLQRAIARCITNKEMPDEASIAD